MGFADWLTTIVGIIQFGAVEINPLFANLTQTSLITFSIMKLSATILISYAFYKAYNLLQQAEQTKKNPRANYYLGKSFLQSGYLFSLIFITGVVINNVIAISRVL